MSFFKDFKDDLSLVVNELLPGEDMDNEDELEEASEMMVNTLEGELDIESELSKLDGLLEHVEEKKAEAKRVELEAEEPVLEQLPQLEPESVELSEFELKPQRKPESARAEEPQQKAGPAAVESAWQKEDADFTRRAMKTMEKPEKTENPEQAEKTEPVELPLWHNDGHKAAAAPAESSGSAAAAPKADKAREEPHFSFDVREEDFEPEPMPQPEPAIIKMSQKNRSMQTNAGIKEELPMNEEMTKETVSMEAELAAETPEITDEVSIITPGTNIKGNLATTGSFSINGRVEGNVQCNGKLEVTGTIKGNSSSSEVFSDAAKIEGEIVSTGTVKIGLGSVVVGNISATSAVIAGAVKGDIDVQGPVVVDTSAVIVGNIKSRSVQINNGAVIEGFCSQCYADIDVESLFGDSKKGR